MFNSQLPSTADLPTSKQLVRSTGIAAVVAGILLVTVVLPSEYAVDTTGVGTMLGLAEMGEIKVQLAAEAEADAVMDATTAEAAMTAAVKAAAVPTPAAGTSPAAAVEPAAAAAARSDTITVTLAPGKGAEVKATAAKGVRIAFDWSVTGGVVNYDTHADAPGISYHGYGKGKGSAGEKGVIVAAFDGKHGWFWRNRGDAPITVTLRTQGGYAEVRRVV